MNGEEFMRLGEEYGEQHVSARLPTIFGEVTLVTFVVKDPSNPDELVEKIGFSQNQYLSFLTFVDIAKPENISITFFFLEKGFGVADIAEYEEDTRLDEKVLIYENEETQDGIIGVLFGGYRFRIKAFGLGDPRKVSDDAHVEIRLVHSVVAVVPANDN